MHIYTFSRVIEKFQMQSSTKTKSLIADNRKCLVYFKSRGKRGSVCIYATETLICYGQYYFHLYGKKSKQVYTIGYNTCFDTPFIKCKICILCAYTHMRAKVSAVSAYYIVHLSVRCTHANTLLIPMLWKINVKKGKNYMCAAV